MPDIKFDKLTNVINNKIVTENNRTNMQNNNFDTEAINNKIIARQNTLLSNKSNNIGGFLLSFVVGIIYIIIIVLINSNIIFMLKYANELYCNKQSLLDIWFPSDCNKYPFGPHNDEICENPKHFDFITNQNGGSNCDKTKWFKENKLFKVFFGDYLKNSTDSDWPYKDYDKSSSLWSWYVKAVAKTNVNLNQNTKTMIYLSQSLPNTLLMIVGAVIMLVLLSGFNAVYTAAFLIWNLFSTANFVPLSGFDWVSRFGSIFILAMVSFFTLFFFPIGISFMYSSWKSILIIFKLAVFPIIFGGHNGVLKLIKEHQTLIAYAIGFMMVLSASSNLERTFSDSMMFAYIFFVILHIGTIIYNKLK